METFPVVQTGGSWSLCPLHSLPLPHTLATSMSFCLIQQVGMGTAGTQEQVSPNNSFWLFSFRKPAIPAGPLADLPMVRGLWAAVAHAHFASWSLSLHEASRP